MFPSYSLLSQGLGGIQPVDVPGIENVSSLIKFPISLYLHCVLVETDYFPNWHFQVDVTQIVEGHSSYLWKTKQILEQLELDSYYPVFRTTLKPKEDNTCVN